MMLARKRRSADPFFSSTSEKRTATLVASKPVRPVHRPVTATVLPQGAKEPEAIHKLQSKAGLPKPGELSDTLGRNLALARFALGVTQDNLAVVSGISRATIAQIESSNTDPRLGTLADLAGALGVSPSLLLLKASDIASLLHVVRQSSVERVLAELSPERVEEMNQLRRTGFQKDLLRLARVGIDAAESAGFTTPGAAVGAGIGSAILPGLGTAVGTIFGLALDPMARHQAGLEEGAGI
jgi:transcriptional regulator with XRE-family HTH domain